mgnify:CR=1 FL=1
MNVLKKQKTNSIFDTKFINLINHYNIETKYLMIKFKEFETHNVDDIIFKIILKSMLDTPYYNDIKELNILEKFRILQDKLQILNDNDNLIDENILIRLDKF